MDVVVLDLDGTLLRSDKTISQRASAVLRRLKDMGQTLVFATARPPRAVKAVLPAEFAMDYLVCYNGALVLQQGCVRSECAIPAADVRRIFTRLEKNAPCTACGFEHEDQLFVRGSFDRHFSTEFCTPMLPGGPCERSSPKVLVDLAGLDFAAFLGVLPASCYALCTDGGGLCQIMPAGATKESGVAAVLRELGVGFEHVVCFGDDHNDVPLFQRAGCAVAMANAVPELKAIAHAVTGSNDEDGVAEFLEQRYAVNGVSEWCSPAR
ncbi:HAD family hydrolase [Opitutus terrae]|uniref:Cof-like hydrolase n=1 Tax=Opitutus terrae (strain DSM 11246 / JCM 15787 / PB90-1) TaxID=452637 RepID=B1ZXH9_OPITP|nr:HAD family hydrolase [Opitutus terrae]ACB76974.1 Cof-like hydrolase [Opitutus terrae PB90-1]